jgi:ribose-phosphate pyrophosphokinase
MMLILGPASEQLGEKIAENLCSEVHRVDHRLFPDGESYIRLKPTVKNKKVVLVQTTAPYQDSKLMQLLMMAKTVKEMGASKILACVPYLGYSRQDQSFRNGEVVTLDLVLNLLDSTGIEELIVVDIHNEEKTMTLAEKYSMRVYCLTAIPLIAGYLKSHGYCGAYSISPDIGRKKIVQKASLVLGGGFGCFEKIRDRKDGNITMKIRDLELEGKKAVVFDDIISSGGTMSKAINGLKEQGATRVAAACTHALFMEGAEERLKKAGADDIIATDTIVTPYSKVTVAGLVANHLQEL